MFCVFNDSQKRNKTMKLVNCMRATTLPLIYYTSNSIQKGNFDFVFFIVVAVPFSCINFGISSLIYVCNIARSLSFTSLSRSLSITLTLFQLFSFTLFYTEHSFKMLMLMMMMLRLLCHCRATLTVYM